LLHESRFSSPWVGRRPMKTPVGMTILLCLQELERETLDVAIKLSSVGLWLNPKDDPPAPACRGSAVGAALNKK
jgi:hypothetical protein